MAWFGPGDARRARAGRGFRIKWLCGIWLPAVVARVLNWWQLWVLWSKVVSSVLFSSTFLFLFPKQLGQTPIAVNFWVDERRYGDLNCG